MPTPIAPVDPDVKLPPGVAAQAAAANAAHAAAYANQNPDPQPDPSLPAPAAPPVPAPQPAPPPAQSTEPPAPVPPQPGADENLTADQWRHRYLSMEGRYKQAATSIGSLQEQMAELGDELVRTQTHQRSQPVRQNDPVPQAALTDEEIKTYGPELIDVISRAARAAVMPDMQNLHTGVQQVNQRVQRVSTGGVYQTLDREVPDWRAINVSDRFKGWCSQRDVYSGAVRGRLLNAAFQAADAPRAVAFFKGFLTEEQATGQLPDPSIQPQSPAPRTPAIQLDSLTAPGRAKPAGGDTPLPVDKPIFTRNQIASFYREVREGRFAGRDADKNSQEQAIFLAQREGRVR